MKLWKLTAISVMAIMLVACKGKEEPKAPVIKTAKVMTIKAPANVHTRYFPGKVEASNRVNLSFEVSGKVETFPVVEGAKLKKGALVASLNQDEYKYNLSQTQARYDLAKSQEQRYGTLVKEGHVAVVDYDKQKAAFHVAEADLKQAKKNLQDTILKAPFDGTIIKKYVKQHQQIKPNEHIVSFQDVNVIDIRVSLPENVIANIKKETKHNLKVTFEAVPKRSFKVEIKEFSAEADPETQTYDAVLMMSAPKDVNILPGMTATLILSLPIRNVKSDIFNIPVNAVFKSEQGAPSVWLVEAKTHKIKAQSVKTGRLVGDNIQIISGIKPGDVVVTAGVHFLHANDEIKPLQDSK